MKKKWINTGIFIATILFGVNTQAQDREKGRGGGSPEKLIELLDTDKDGKLSKEEASKDKRGKLVENFEAIDTDEDGLLDTDELKTHMEEIRGKREQ